MGWDGVNVALVLVLMLVCVYVYVCISTMHQTNGQAGLDAWVVMVMVVV